MKSDFAKEIERVARKDRKTVFLTGDLGFNAFESLRKHIGERFINAGVAEQNMVDVAAGLAYAGLQPWVYSIAPFLILKTVEQIRNDVAQRSLPVRFVGNGGGFGYGIMGTTHHLLEDIAILSTFPNMKIFVPAFNSDIHPIVEKMSLYSGPSYLRLGTSGVDFATYAGVRNIRKGSKVTVIVLGPLAERFIQVADEFKEAVDLWVVTELPVKILPKFFDSISKTQKLIIAEEHSYHGGLGQTILSELGKRGVSIQVSHMGIKDYKSKLYGNQNFHLEENGLGYKQIFKAVKDAVHE